jgi:hypothetical protein
MNATEARIDASNSFTLDPSHGQQPLSRMIRVWNRVRKNTSIDEDLIGQGWHVPE